MAWNPRAFGPATRTAIIYAPNANARVQDLGPFVSGKHAETDILPKSALVAPEASIGQPQVNEQGKVFFALEGNAYGAVNLETFPDKARCAAGRLTSRAPSIAFGEADLADLVPIARYDLLRNTFIEIIDTQAFRNWTDEDPAELMPTQPIPTPTDDPDIVLPLCRFPMIPIHQEATGPFVWGLLDGTLLTKASPDNADRLQAWGASDDGLFSHLVGLGIDHAKALVISGQPPEPDDDPSP